jgi:hypothetical protein
LYRSYLEDKIDGLVVKNKELRRKLRRYERLYDAQVQERLFEVRFHGLPARKEKELEELLRKFAKGLDDTVASARPHVVLYTSALGEGEKVSSTVQPTKPKYSRRLQSVLSYLHDILPDLRLREKNAQMSEKLRKKLVVQRLEQIFAGKQPVLASYPQPMQQEKVAQSAAIPGRQAREAILRRLMPEGTREARIMPDGIVSQNDITCNMRLDVRIGNNNSVGADLLEQRPTRLQDVDPNRVQVATENMEYLRHLGFTPPDVLSGKPPKDGQGWLHLNLLVNMAQLHTLNVTPDFVKDALIRYSSRLELSGDQRKIRWKGGTDVTRCNGGSSSEQCGSCSPYDGLRSQSPLRPCKADTSGPNSEHHVDLEQRTKTRTQVKEEIERKDYTNDPMQRIQKGNTAENIDLQLLDGSLTITCSCADIREEVFQGSEEVSEYTYKSEDGSVDLLGVAPKLDPVTIQAMEREYDLSLEGCLAKETDVRSAGVRYSQ